MDAVERRSSDQKAHRQDKFELDDSASNLGRRAFLVISVRRTFADLSFAHRKKAEQSEAREELKHER